MICDGHNETGELNGDQFVYRPLRMRHRKAVWEELRRFPQRIAMRLEREIVESRIVAAEWSCAVHDFDDETYAALWKLTFGIGRTEQEQADETNLHRGVYVLRRWPHMERVSCEQCRVWQWNPLTGEQHKQMGVPLKRRCEGTLCDALSREWGQLSGTACPRGYWAKPNDLSEKNRLAYQHYQACEAAGSFLDDPLVMDNARIIRDAIRLSEQDEAADGRAGGRGRQSDQLRHPAVRRRTGVRTASGITGAV